MMLRLPSPGPIDWGRFALGPPVGDAAALGAAEGVLPATLGTAVRAGVVTGDGVALLPVQAPTSRPTVASMVNPVLYFIASPPGRSGVDRQAVLTLPDEANRAALRRQRLHRRGDQVLLGDDELRAGV